MKYSPHALRMFVALLVIGAFTLPVLAVPVTFQFEATVEPLSPFHGDVGLPFVLEEGSVIDGLLTIDPELGEPPFGNSSKSVQPFGISLSFDGFSFGAEMYEATAINDSGISDGPNAGPADFINFSCSTGGAVACSMESLEFSGTGPLTFGMTMKFAGDLSLLSEPALPNDVDVWNDFMIFRELRFTFVGEGDGELFDATLSSFTVVPEPSVYLLVLIGMNVLVSKRNRKMSPIL